MSDVIPYPINFETKGITGRDGYIVAEALYFATKWIDEMPDKVRPSSDQRDILRILNAAFPGLGRCFRARLENLQIVHL